MDLGLAGRAEPGGSAVRKAQTALRAVCVRAHLLGASQARRVLPGTGFAAALVAFDGKPPTRELAAGGTRQGRFVRRRGAQPRGRRASARFVLILAAACLNAALNAAREARAVSFAARPRGEHRSAVDAKRRPPQHEPLAGAARRDAQNAGRDSGLSWAAAMRRKPIHTQRPVVAPERALQLAP